MNPPISIESTPDAQTFEQLGIIPAIAETLKTLGYESPTAIQHTSIPILLNGQDLLGQAQTGTGKTGAFALPLLCRLDLSKRAPQILVLTPTRELTIQVAEAFQSYARKLNGFHVLPIYGGQSMATQLHQLKRGPHVIVGTPGRVMDHLRRKTLNLEKLQAVVLDEADEMLNMGFVEDIEWILEHTPTEKQIALFSATMPEQIRRVASTYLRNQKEVKIKSKTSTVEATSQFYWLVTGLHKLDALTRMLEVEEFDACIIFVRTKTATVELAEKLEARGHACAALNGDLSQELRERTINSMKKGSLDIIVATDVAARGLDVERISHVINYDIPHDPEAYVHRIGRTGRAGRTGKAILFVSQRERRLLASIERATKQPIEPFQLPTKKEVSERRIQRFKDQIQETLNGETDLSFYLPIVQQLASDNGKTELDVASALCYLMQQESPFIVEETTAPKFTRDRDSRDRDGGGRGFREDRRRDFDDSDSRGRRPRRNEYRDDSDKMTFRIEVGRNHGAGPSNIVGAIANSVGIDGRDIGSIQLYDDFSTVDLPKTLSSDILAQLEDVHVMDRKLHIAPFHGDVAPKKAFDKRGPNKKGFGRKYEENKDGEKKFPAKKFGDKKFGEKKFGESKFGEKKFGKKKFSDKKFGAESPAKKRDSSSDKPWLKNKKQGGKGPRDRA